MARRDILMLNISYMPLGLIDWQKAICLVFQGKAEVVAETDKVVRSPTREYKVPSIIRLNKHVYVKRRGMRLSRKNLLYRDKFTCQYCGKVLPTAKLNMDHVQPKSRGGKTTWENIVAACIVDNSRKGNKTPEEAGMRLMRQPSAPVWTLRDEIRSSIDNIPEEWKIYLPKL